MGNAADVQFIAETEPWRRGLGRPRSIIDPLWSGDTLLECSATVDDIEWDVTGRPWWWCRICGHCSDLTYLKHYVVETPQTYFVMSEQQFMTRRATQGFPTAETQAQAQYIMGVVLRIAASKPPEQFGRLIESILRLAD